MKIRAVALLVCAVPSLAQEVAPVPSDAHQGVEAVPVELKHRFSAATKLVYESRQTVEVEQRGLGRTSVETMFEVVRELEPAEGGGATGVETWRAVMHGASAGVQAKWLDTRDGTRSGEPDIDCLEALVGGTVRWTLDAAGKVSGLEGGPALADRVLAKVPAEQQELWRQQLAATFSNEVLARQAQEGFLPFPEGPLQPGATWTHADELAIAPLGDLARTQDLTYLGLTDRAGTRCAKLWVRTRVAEVAERRVVIQGQPVLASIGAFEGSAPLLVRVEDGALLESGPQELAYTLKLNVGGQVVECRYGLRTRLEARAP